jgi:hypothetical protein
MTTATRKNSPTWAIANVSFKQQQGNKGVTEIVEIKNRGRQEAVSGVSGTPQCPTASLFGPVEGGRA